MVKEYIEIDTVFKMAKAILRTCNFIIFQAHQRGESVRSFKSGIIYQKRQDSNSQLLIRHAFCSRRQGAIKSSLRQFSDIRPPIIYCLLANKQLAKLLLSLKQIGGLISENCLRLLLIAPCLLLQRPVDYKLTVVILPFLVDIFFVVIL